MELFKYKWPILIFIIVSVFTATLYYMTSIALPDLLEQDLAYFLPFIGPTELIFALMVIWPIMALIGGILGTFIGPVLLLLHKKTIGRNMIYGIENVYISEKFKRIFQGFFPGLMAINFSMLLSDYTIIQTFMTTPWVVTISNQFSDPQTFMKLITFIVTITFTLMITFCLFSGLWGLNDSGIVFSNKSAVEKKRKEKPIIGESVGGWYNYLLKGYAGIGVLVAYYELIFIFFGVINLGYHLLSDIMNIYLFLLYFILLPIFTIPAIIVLDVLRDWRVEFTRKFAAKLGIIKNVEIEMKEVK